VRWTSGNRRKEQRDATGFDDPRSKCDDGVPNGRGEVYAYGSNEAYGDKMRFRSQSVDKRGEKVTETETRLARTHNERLHFSFLGTPSPCVPRYTNSQ
jgi:hypothetical protein